jgi:hypothetical protein
MGDTFSSVFRRRQEGTVKRWRRLLARLLALLGAAGLAAYVWTFISAGPVPPPPPVPSSPSPPRPTDLDVADQGDVTISFDDATSSGDVHIHTADGFYYDLQLVGEFTALKSTADDLEIQVRQGPWQGSSKTISTNLAVAMNVAGDRVGIYVGRNSILVNGQAIPIPDQPVALPKGGQIAPGNNRISVIWPDQTTAQVMSHGSYLDLLVELDNSRSGKVAGLFGNFDRNPVNDLTTRDGVLIAGRSPAQDPKEFQQRLYQQFGNSWRIRQADSLFTYGPGESTATWTDLAFPYQIVSAQSLDQTVRQHAEDVCKQAGITVSQFLLDCILDVGETGEAQFAQSTSQMEAAVKLPEGLVCQQAPLGGDKCTNYRPSLPDARIGTRYRFTIETMVGTSKQVESFDCSLIDASRRASCGIKTKGAVFDGSNTVASYTLDSGEPHEDHRVMRPR